jgi:hypothetical protein
MTEDRQNTTILIDPDIAREADAIAAVLSELVGVKISRSAAARRAIHDLFLRLCPSDQTDAVADDKIAA